VKYGTPSSNSVDSGSFDVVVDGPCQDELALMLPVLSTSKKAVGAIGHQGIPMYLNGEALHTSGDYAQEPISVLVVGKDSPFAYCRGWSHGTV